MDTAHVEIESSMRAMGALVERQLSDSLVALRTAGLGMADAVVRGDAEVNAARYAIEDAVADELQHGGNSADRVRFLIAALSIVNDLERMGDHCEGIAKVALMLGSDPVVRPSASIATLGEMVQAMFAEGLQAFEVRDGDGARATCAKDDAIDSLYDQLYGELLETMGSDRQAVVPCTYLLWAAHNLERIADRVTNVCERTVYLVTGRLDELNVSNY